MAKRKLPQKVLVYQADETDGVPVYFVAENVNEIDDEYDGVPIGIYTLNRTHTLRIKRELK